MTDTNNCSTWLKKRITDLSGHKLWIRDADSLLETPEIRALEEFGKAESKEIFVVKHSLELRLRLRDYGDNPPPRWIVVDQSVPVDSKATKSREIFAPDLRHSLAEKNFQSFTIRDYLVAQTNNDESWPDEVKEFPYRELARKDPVVFLNAYQDFRRVVPRGFSTLDLMLIAAGAVLEKNLFKLSPLDMLWLSGKHSQKCWQELAEFFNKQEIEIVKVYLRKQQSPLGHLFSSTSFDRARLATLSLMLLSRYSSLEGTRISEEPAAYLTYISSELDQYQKADPLPLPDNPPPWLETEYAEVFDKPPYISSLISLLNLDNPTEDQKRRTERANDFLNTNPPSPGLRQQVQIMLGLSGVSLAPAIRETSQTYHPSTLGSLVAEFNQAQKDIEAILTKAKQLEKRLATTPISAQSIDWFIEGFGQDGIYKLEILIDRLSRCIRGIDSNSELKELPPNFGTRWLERKEEAVNRREEADKALKTLDYRLARLLEARYKEVIPGKILQTWQVYEKFIVSKRSGPDGKLRPAAIVIFDGMRYDSWRELIRPRLEKKYQVDHEIIAMATLPSETIVSRRASFAGLEPARITSPNELELFNELLKRVHHTDPKLVAIEDNRIASGISAFSFRSRDGLIQGIVFDFPDKSGHALTWGHELLMNAWSPILNEIDNWLSRLPKNADIFIYSDHGHVLPGSGRINLLRETCLEEDVGYRCARLKRKIEGEKARHFVQIPSGDLGHPPGFFFAFPLPDYSFAPLDPTRRFRPTERYRHSGISMYELFIPFAHLRNREQERRFTLGLYPVDTYRVGQEGKIHAELRAEPLVTETVELTSPTDDINPAKIQNIGPDGQLITLKFKPTRPGNIEIEVAAFLGAERIATKKLSIYVEPGQEAPDDRIRRMFGD